MPEFATVTHRDGWKYHLLARVRREPGSPHPLPPSNAVLLGESVGTVPAGAVVEVRWLRGIKDASNSPIGEPLVFKVAEGRPGKLRFRWYTYDSKNPLMASRWFLDIHDEYTGQIFHRVEDDFARPVKFISPIFKPDNVQNFTLGPQAARAAVHKIIHAEPVAPTGKSLTEWWEVIMTVTPGPFANPPAPAFRLPEMRATGLESAIQAIRQGEFYILHEAGQTPRELTRDSETGYPIIALPVGDPGFNEIFNATMRAHYRDQKAAKDETK